MHFSSFIFGYTNLLVAISLAFPLEKATESSSIKSVKRYTPSPTIANISLDVSGNNVNLTDAPTSILGHGTTSPGASPSCWPPNPVYVPPITNPRDCGNAIIKMLEGWGSELVFWTGQSLWTYRSCSIWLIPNDPYSANRGDTFSRLEIAQKASIIQLACVTRENGFRGGIIEIGPLNVFDVAVEDSSYRQGEFVPVVNLSGPVRYGLTCD